MASKYYVVRQGRQPGIYRDWASCEAQVKGYSGAVYKSFKSEAEAQLWLAGESPSQVAPAELAEGVLRCYIDGSFDKGSGAYSYGLVAQFGEKYWEEGAWDSNPRWSLYHNVAGELFGAMRAMNLAAELGAEALEIFFDYQGIASWATGEWQANNPLTQSYAAFARKAQEGCPVSFYKVKAHSGVEANERADELAKEALQTKSGKINIDLL